MTLRVAAKMTCCRQDDVYSMDADEMEDQEQSRMTYTRDVRPVPDPTVLTTATIRRELASLKEIVTVRLDAMDRAQTLFNDNLTRVPTEVDKQITHTREWTEGQVDVLQQRFQVTEEKFRSIQVQFIERDTRTEQTSRDSKVAVDAALQAAKEAVGAQNTSSALAIAKSESATAKQIDQLTTLFQTAIGAMDAKFNDLKDRILIIEGRTLGLSSATTIQQGTTQNTLGVIGLIAAIVGILIGAAIAFLKR